MNSMKVLALILSAIGLVFGGVCPPADDIAPCTCDGATIRCNLIREFDLEEMFAAVAHGFLSGQNQFEVFELSSTVLEELGAGIFQGVVFRQIKITNGPKLHCIHPSAFTGNELFTQGFTTTFANLSSLSKDCDVFQAVSRLNLINTVSIIGSDIQEIPEKAFHGRAGPLVYLTTIDFSGPGGQGGAITKIGKNAFAELKALTKIDLSSHAIATVEMFAFSFNEASTGALTINLEHNQLTGDSFASSAFAVDGRVCALKLGSNIKLKYLKESVFHSFLENMAYGKNSIDLIGTLLDPVPENLWLIENRVTLELSIKITNIMASDGEMFWKLKKSDFGTTTAPNGTTAKTGPDTTTGPPGSTVSGAGSTASAAGSSVSAAGSSVSAAGSSVSAAGSTASNADTTTGPPETTTGADTTTKTL